MDAATTTDDDGLEALLDYVKDNRGFDFTGYKRATLRRRISKRMEVVRCRDFREYLAYLTSHEPEFGELFNTILINVTSFYRDGAPWDVIRDEVLPSIVEQKGDGEPIRIWVPGCASGEEAYTIAILLADRLGETSLRERVKIYATDVDLEALETGRRAAYPMATLAEHVPPDVLERYFDVDEGTATFRSDLRRTVIFGRHDLLQDPPISRVDLLSCRNTLMYFTAATQLQILENFRFALRPRGYLLLGRSETLATRSSLFVPFDLKRRIFTVRDTGPLPRAHVARSRHAETGGAVARDDDIRAAGFEIAQCAQLLVDEAGSLAAANQHARVLFGIASGDIGRPLQDLEVSYRPLELRSQLDTVRSESRQVVVRAVEVPNGAEIRLFDVVVAPVDSDGAPVGASVSFVEITSSHRLQQELDRSRAELETAYEELQSTVEELETTNEELQSTNEELETTNEELQSTNEELETMNEELQSTNEELETINDELRQRTDDLNDVNAFLEAILASLNSGVIVVDRDMRIQVWNEQSAELWGLRADEVEGGHLMNLDIGLPLEQLHGPVRSCLAGEAEIETSLDAINRRGRAVSVRIRVSPLRNAQGTPIGAILVMETGDGGSGSGGPSAETEGA